jgi:Ca-activated chloride channel family protein
MSAETAAFEFAQPLWLWALLIPPLLWWWPQSRRTRKHHERLARYADQHLLPHLLLGDIAPGQARRRMMMWSLLWALGVLAMAGPRWDYTTVNLYQPGTNLVILMDLSRSMDVTDVKPSRLARARQEIEDLLRTNKGIRVGLIGFASVAHVVSPITEDAGTLRNLLPSLSTDLVQMHGSRVQIALERARRLLSGQPPNGVYSLLLVTDGDFEAPELEAQARELREQGYRLHVLGVGTPQGGYVPAPGGGWVQERGQTVISRLNEALLGRIAEAGGGSYHRADFLEDDTRSILDRLESEGRPQALEERAHRIWNERYYLLVAVMMLLMLGWYRRTRRMPQ